ncbi:hypothetical protein Pcinc_016953 [Petrolisthes cinctipes]|uniref:DUF4209 domain-containing protein n=1 Tax=Petrolisthes cinctipes TaxID=88211 RepID=A0AAE1FQ01_PETCI|nr:hypothetical protein Pcinc_016953 [Petrolisthes cinctipes]
MVQVLRILVGSVFGLNLRNLAWHGFLTPQQICPAFPASLIIILADSAHTLQTSPSQEGPQLGTEALVILQGSGISAGAKICTRPLITFHERVFAGQVFEGVNVTRECGEEIATTSPVVPTVMVPVWIRVFQLMETDRYGLAMTLLLPALECSLRCLFAVANQTPQRLLTAQTSAFYTTLDQILHPKVDHQENSTIPYLAQKFKTNTSQTTSNSHQSKCLGNDNKTLRILGRKLNEALHDLLNFPQGPRVRDRRVDPKILKYKDWSRDERFGVPDILKCEGTWFCTSTCEGNNISASIIGNCVQDDDDLYCKPILGSHKTIDYYDIPNLMDGIREMDYLVLYRPRAESEAINLLHRISSSIFTALENIRENLEVKYKQFLEKKLRSRQRETYRRQLDAVPKIVASCFLTAQVVCLIFSSIQRMATSHLTTYCHTAKQKCTECSTVTWPTLESGSHRKELPVTIVNSHLEDCSRLSRHENQSDHELDSSTRDNVPTCSHTCKPGQAITESLSANTLTCPTHSQAKEASHQLVTSETFPALMKILKSLLKIQENIVSYSSLSCNRWEEALHISEENISLI